MCDEYTKNSDHLRIAPNERIVTNSEIDQQWADWLAPSRRSFLFGAGVAAIGLTLAMKPLKPKNPKPMLALRARLQPSPR